MQEYVSGEHSSTQLYAGDKAGSPPFPLPHSSGHGCMETVCFTTPCLVTSLLYKCNHVFRGLSVPHCDVSPPRAAGGVAFPLHTCRAWRFPRAAEPTVQLFFLLPHGCYCHLSTILLGCECVILWSISLQEQAGAQGTHGEVL